MVQLIFPILMGVLQRFTPRITGLAAILKAILSIWMALLQNRRAFADKYLHTSDSFSHTCDRKGDEWCKHSNLVTYLMFS